MQEKSPNLTDISRTATIATGDRRNSNTINHYFGNYRRSMVFDRGADAKPALWHRNGITEKHMKHGSLRHFGVSALVSHARSLRAAAFALGLATIALGGCVAYEPAPAPAYYAGPYYAAPAPYYAPCCATYFDFDYRSGHRGWDHHGWHRWH